MGLNCAVEDAALAWFGELGYAVRHGPQLAPGEPAAERDSFGELVLVGRLREAIRDQITEEGLNNSEFALLVSITGLDETLSQTLHARHSYFSTDIRLHHRFRDMLEVSDDGNRQLDLRRIDEVEQVSSRAA